MYSKCHVLEVSNVEKKLGILIDNRPLLISVNPRGIPTIGTKLEVIHLNDVLVEFGISMYWGGEFATEKTSKLNFTKANFRVSYIWPSLYILGGVTFSQLSMSRNHWAYINLYINLCRCCSYSINFFKMFLADTHMSYFVATGTPILKFWWCLLWVSRPEWVLPYSLLQRWM